MLDPDAGCVPPPLWTRGRDLAGGVVVFTELMTDPADPDAGDWVELTNTLAIPVDLSGWRLDDAARFTFPADTVLGAGERLVVARDPADLAARAPAARVLGPLDGGLAREGERLDLYDRGGRRMESVGWSDGPPWPALPEGSGRSLARRDPLLAGELAESWMPGPPGGTPGAPETEPGVLPPAVEILVPPDARWRYEIAADPGADWAAPDFDDGGWAEGEAPLYAGAPPRAVGEARFTADNHFALYLGPASGEALRPVGRDRQGDWQSAEVFPLDIGPGDHLYAAAWEAPGDSGSPQMLIGTHAVADGPLIGTRAAEYEAVLGPPGLNPGGDPAAPGPDPDAVAAHVRASAGGWAAPAAERAADQGPWNGALGGVFGGDAAYVWLDTFDPDSATNRDETYALFRTRAPLLGPPGRTEIALPQPWLWLRIGFDFAGDPAETRLSLDLLADDGAVVLLNGVEVHRRNVAPGAIGPATRALAAVDPVGSTPVALATDALRVGPNVLAVALFQAPAPDVDLRFAATLRADRPPPLPLAGPPDPTGAAVISEVMYHPRSDPDPAAPAPPEWIELHNPGPAAVDLSGWALVDGVAFAFPDGASLDPGGYAVVTGDVVGFAAVWPDVPAFGPWQGGLSSRGERLRLLDRCGAPVDDLRFYDGGRWPEQADGGGSSLELRDVRADNGSPDAWAASDEAPRAGWQVIEYRDVARPSAVGPDGRWHELVIGLLDAGVALIDDISVIEDPDGAARELIANGGFDGGDAAGWRLLGTHRRGTIVPDPDDPQNPVLRLEATGSTEHMHNHVETTLLGGAQIRDGTTYAIRLRARWVAGSEQLNTRLYFNRLARTTRLAVPEGGGTPGAPNSARTAALGPTFADAGYAPVVPRPGQSIRVAAVVSDPDGVAEARLWWALDGEPFASLPMASVGGDRFEVDLPGQAAGALLHLFVQAIDGMGNAAMWPADGAEGRVLAQVDDGAAQRATPGLPTLRLLMTAADRARLYAPTELMSNDRLGATLIVDEARVHHGVGVRAKGSERGRPTDVRFGYSLGFDPADPFRGVYDTISLDRSEGVGFGQRELLMDLVLLGAGAPSAEYNDLGHLIAPRGSHTGPVLLQLARFGDLLLDNRFERGGDGMLFEYELVYFPLTTDDGTATGRKLPQPDAVVGTSLRDLGEDPEAYRHVFLIKNNRDRDDYGGIIAFAQVFGMGDADFRRHAADVIDVDQWLEAFALSSLSGAIDHYADGAQHNVQFYVRPSHGRVLYFPHDLDFYPGDPRRAVVGNRDLRRLLAEPGWRRAFYRHLRRIIGSVYCDACMAPWRDRIAPLLPGQDFAGHHAFLAARSDYVMNEAPDGVMGAVPPVPFAVTSPAPGAEVPAGRLVLQGTAWLDVAAIAVVGAPALTAVRWVAAGAWALEVQVAPGQPALAIEALDDAGAVLAVVELPLVVTP